MKKHGGKRAGAGKPYQIYRIRRGKPVVIDGEVYAVRDMTGDSVLLTSVTGKILEIKNRENP